ncbi:MAG: LexA family protein [Runella sp.]
MNFAKDSTSEVKIYSIELNLDELALPLYQSYVAAGFPSPADDYVEVSLDLLKYLVDKPQATFCVRVSGNSMEGAMICEGSILIVDRSKTPKNNDIVIAVLEGEFTVKRFQKKGNQCWLIPEHPAYEPILITEDMDFQVWGVVTYIINQPK